jgi:toxin ParE1/3/4
MIREVIFRPSAVADLKEIYDYIERHSPESAARYVEWIEAYCMKLAHFSERGTRRDELKPGIRIIGMQRRVAIAFVVLEDRVEIAGIAYGGRDLIRALREGEF